MGVLSLKASSPVLSLRLFLLDQPNQAFIFIHQVRILGKENLDLFFQLINPLDFPSLEKNFLIEGMDLIFEGAGPVPPVVFSSIKDIFDWATSHPLA